MNGPVELTIDGSGIATVMLDRPEIHNAFDDTMIGALNEVLARIAADRSIRMMCLEGRGRSFCAGADLNWMRRSSDYSPAENLADAEDLARLMASLDRLEIPTIALVQGAAFGGGVGLVACCDIAIAAEGARFGFSEVRLGLIPAVISPYVIRAIGARQARRYFQTGEVIDAATALRLGLVHEVVPSGAVAATWARIIDALRQGGPSAMRAAKTLVADVANRPIETGLMSATAQLISAHRASPEGREGLAAFLEKRAPSWRID